MLYRYDELSAYRVHAVDRDVGKIRDLNFDDRFWTVRYLVVDTGGWLQSLVLVSPYSVTSVDPQGEAILTSLTADRIEVLPDRRSPQKTRT